MAKTIKSIVLGVFTLGACLLFWYFLHALLYAEVPTLALRIWTLVFFFVFAVFVGLICFLVDQKTIAFPFLAISSLSFFLFFGYRIGYLICVILFLIVLFLSYEGINSEKKIRIRLTFRKSVGTGLSWILTFCVIMICLAYYYSPGIQAQAQEVKIPKPLFDQGIAQSETIISGFIPGFRKEMTVDDFIFEMTLSTLEKQEEFELPPESKTFLLQEGVDVTSKEEIFKAIRENPKVKEKFMEMMKEQQKEGGQGPEELFKGLGVEVKGDEKIADVLYKLANQKLNEFAGPYKKYIPLAASIGLFFILRILMIPFGWFVILVSWILFTLLKTTQVVRIEKVQKEVEIIEM